MKKFYSSLKQLTIAATFFCSLFSTYAFGQTPVCGPVVEDFDNTGGTTANFSGSFSLNPSGGNLQKTRVISNGAYIITTPTYQLANNANSLGYGFTLGGTQIIGRVSIRVAFVSTQTGAIETVELGNFVPNYNSSGVASICGAVALSSIQGFSP